MLSLRMIEAQIRINIVLEKMQRTGKKSALLHVPDKDLAEALVLQAKQNSMTAQMIQDIHGMHLVHLVYRGEFDESQTSTPTPVPSE